MSLAPILRSPRVNLFLRPAPGSSGESLPLPSSSSKQGCCFWFPSTPLTLRKHRYLLVKSFLGSSDTSDLHHCLSLFFPAAPQNFTLSQETPEDDPKGRQAFQAGWFNDLVTMGALGAPNLVLGLGPRRCWEGRSVPLPLVSPRAEWGF